MPVYEYQGMSAAGKKVRGVLDAESPRALRDALKGEGVFLTDYLEGKEAKTSSSTGSREIRFKIGGRVSLRDVAVFTRQLATLQRAGIPLVESLTALVDQTEKESFKKIISEVRQMVSEGTSLAAAMAQHPKTFSDLYVNMIRAGESSGNLDIVLERLTDFLDDQVELRSQLTSAMVYPSIMMLLGFFIVAFLMAFVIPRVTQLFTDMQTTLPLITRILIGFSQLLTSTWWLLLIGIIAAVVLFRRWKATPEGSEAWDRFVLRVPLFGNLTRLIAISRFSKTLGTLLASGVPLLTAMDIVKNILGNRTLIEVVEQARLNIREGESIAAPLKRSGHFPPLVTHMIAIGERTGSLEDMLNNVADSYERQVSSRISAMTTLLEPLMIVGMGVVVAFIVFAILLPILKLNEGLM